MAIFWPNLLNFQKIYALHRNLKKAKMTHVRLPAHCELRVEHQPQQSNTEEAAPDSLLSVSQGPWSCFILDVKNICINYSFLRFLIFEIFENMKTRSFPFAKK